MPPARTATAALLMGAVAGCGLGADATAVLGHMMPNMAYNDAPVAANITADVDGGTTFRPAYQFDTAAGSADVEVNGFSAKLVGPAVSGQSASFALDDVTWVSVGVLSATIPPGLPGGQYDLIVGDPRGHSAHLAGAFTSLGMDSTPPTVSITSPLDGGVIGARAPVNVLVVADDGYGVLGDLQVTITAGTAALSRKVCSLTGGPRASCTFAFQAPAPMADGDMLSIEAQATGSGGLVQTARASMPLVPAPVATGISPNVGSTQGRTAVTLSGTNFVVGATQVAFDGQVATLYDFTATSITALTPPHAAGLTNVTVTTGGATSILTGAFTYLPPPTVREVSPTSGPAGGFTPITIVGENFSATTTVITFDGRLLVCPTFVNANRIQGFTPPGNGTERIEASDAVGGSIPDADVPYQYLATVVDAGADGSVYTAAVTPDGGCPGSVHP